MKVVHHLLLFLLISIGLQTYSQAGLKDAYKNDFLMGVALGDKIISSNNSEFHSLVNIQYNSIVAENCMKMGRIHPIQGEFDFTKADRFIKYGQDRKMTIIGHTLVWHSQVPDWIFKNKSGEQVDREELIKRMQNHIHTVVGRYKGSVHGWDVVNEAILGSGELRPSKWLEIIGPEYIELAFQFASDADPGAELYYNDYGMDNRKKREAVVQLVKKLKQKGIKIHGIGMQAHYGLDLSLEKFENSVKAFAATGLKVMITELDITVLPFPSKKQTADVNQKHEYQKKYNPYTLGLPLEIQNKQAELYKGIFEILLKHNEAISRVTFWGLNDATSWKNNWPIKGRTDYPLLFDRNNKPKPVYNTVIKVAKEQ